MPKKYENMTTDERIAFHVKERAKERALRQVHVNKLQTNQQACLYKLNSVLGSVLSTALYPDMGGIRMVSAYELQELSDLHDTLKYEFNLDVD